MYSPSSASSSAAAAAAAVAGEAHSNLAARKLFDYIIVDEAANHFKVLPDLLLHAAYYHIVARPVCLADISMAINSGHRYSVEDELRDLRRMLSNAKKYNLPESQVYVDALALEVRGGGFVCRRGGCLQLLAR